MSENILSLKVFFSSPSDLKKERRNFCDIVNDVNHYLDKITNIRLEPIMMETYNYPDVDTDAQNVINKQLPDYDIYVGIIGERIGSPTPRAKSGTIEEYENIYKKNIKNPGSKKILFYIKNVKKQITEIDTNEVQKVQDFISKLGNEGVFYWKYSHFPDFKQYLHFHLFKHCIEFYIKENKDDVKYNKELVLEYIIEGNRQMDLIILCMKYLTEIANEGTKKFQKLGNQLKSPLLKKKPDVLKANIKEFINELRNWNVKLKFNMDVFILIYDLALNNFMKGILGFKEEGELENIINGSSFVLKTFTEFEHIFAGIDLTLEELINFDTVFNTKIINETKTSFWEIKGIVMKSINLTKEFNDFAIKVKNA